MKRAKLSELDLRGLQERIQEYIESEDQAFAHNIIGLILRNISARFGRKAANATVRKMNLRILYGINEEKSK